MFIFSQLIIIVFYKSKKQMENKDTLHLKSIVNMYWTTVYLCEIYLEVVWSSIIFTIKKQIKEVFLFPIFLTAAYSETLTAPPVPTGKPFDPHACIVHAIANIICAVVFGHRFSSEDESFVRLIKAVHVVIYFQATIWGRVRIWFSCSYSLKRICTWQVKTNQLKVNDDYSQTLPHHYSVSHWAVIS